MNVDLFAGMPSLRGAACVGADPALFESSSATTEAQRMEAKAICAGCPVLEACLGYALANPFATEGAMWGGLTPSERRKHRDRRRGGGKWQIHLLQPHGTEAGYARHMRAKERPCDSCRKAHNEYFRLWKLARAL